jgi:hypothetical protein
MEEKRRLRRVNLIHHLRVLNRKTGELLGYLGDITAEGLLLFCPASLSKNEVLPLEIVLPDGEDGSRGIELDARSVWRVKDAQLGLHVTGLKIARISGEDSTLIADTIKTLGSRA